MIRVFFKITAVLALFLFTACENKRDNYIECESIRNLYQSQESNISQNSDTSFKTEPYYKYAWHFAHNSDFAQRFNIDPNANINIEEAWKTTRGADVIVAVIDSGNFDQYHEDLQENVIKTYNADLQNSNITAADEYAHGSTVAGFIASPINGKGLVGAAPEAKLILIQQIYDNDAAAIRAFKYAKDQGARIINCSWGTENVSEIIANYLQELKDYGITIIFASGNEGKDLDFGINDESELNSVIGVGASNEFNDIAFYSNYGQNIDLIAPGGNINKSAGVLGIDDSGTFGSITQRSLVDNNYAFTNGTSFAAPITAGVVALMLGINPNLTPYQIRDILIYTTDQVGEDANYFNCFDTKRAYGKLNATKAVLEAQNY